MFVEQRGSFVGPQLHRRAAGLVRRGALVAAVGALLFLTGCSADQKHEWSNFAMPDPATKQADHIFNLWHWAWVAALITGAIVWGLIFWSIWRYRRRDDNEVPVQTRYNLPLEIFYTIAPLVMVVVLFYWTVNVQNTVLEDTQQDHTINVVGQQWSWTFNYTAEDAVDSENVYTSGTASKIPTLVLPVDETVQFNLYSPDVIHSFGVPGFLMKMDVVPGRFNHFEVTPDIIGDYRGKCYELCGVYHSRMLFNVRVVTAQEYDEYLQSVEDAGFASDAPVLGNGQAYTQAGLDESTVLGGDQ